jgi:hypothetical protein
MDIIGYRGGSVVEGTGGQGRCQLRRGNSVSKPAHARPAGEAHTRTLFKVVVVLTCHILLQVLRELSAIIHQRDALEVENSRLRTIAEQC